MESRLYLLAFVFLLIQGCVTDMDWRKDEKINNKEIYLKDKKPVKQGFTNMGKQKNYLPNTNVPPQNYPVMNNSELMDTVQKYPNPNVATDKYFNQNVYEQKQRAGIPIGQNIQQFFSLTGDYMDTKMFTHNNMVPFNGGKPKGQIYNNNNAETIF